LAFLSFSLVSGLVSELAKSAVSRPSDLPGGTPRVSERGTGTTTLTPRLRDYLSYAVENNPALKASFHNWKARLNKSEYAGALPDPKFSYTYYVENVETRVGPQEQRLGLVQSFPWFGTLGTQKRAAQEGANAAYQQYESAKLLLFYQVKSSYYDYYYLTREIAITHDNMRLLKFWESVVSAKYEADLEPHHELIKAQVELATLENRLQTVEEKVALARARLRAALNAPENTHLPAPTEIELLESSVDSDSVLTRVLAHNPDLKSLLHLVDQSAAKRKLAGKKSLPSFDIGVDYVQTGPAVVTDLADSGKDPWTVKIGISLPVWFGANKARKNESEALYRKARYEFSDAQNRIRVLTEKIIIEHEDALRKTRLYRDGLLPKAEQSLNASYAAYQGGEADFLAVLDAQRQLLEFQLQFERSTADLAISRAAIDMITGQLPLELRSNQQSTGE
jgi:outer membrane protein TolC